MPSSIRFRVWSRAEKGALVIFMLRWVAETMEIRMHVSADTCTKHIHTDMKHPFREIKRMMIITTIAMQVYKKYCKLQRMTALIIITAMAIYPPFQSSPIAPFQRIFHSLFSPPPAVGPESVVVKGLEGPISAGRPQQVVCEARGSRPPAILTWWLDGHMKKSISHMVSSGDFRDVHPQ